MWQWLLSLLTALSADPVAIEVEAPRAAAAVAVAYAAMAPEKPASKCADGKCRVSGASPASDSPSRH